jgi:hypothetical protein
MLFPECFCFADELHYARHRAALALTRALSRCVRPLRGLSGHVQRDAAPASTGTTSKRHSLIDNLPGYPGST